jgi:hypothetical protein
MRLVAIIQIGGIVGDFVGEIDELRFERRALIEQVFREFRMVFLRVIARVLDDAFTYLECQIQAGKRGIALLEIFDDAERVQVVIEREAVLAHTGVERLFSSVPEGGVTDVVHEGERFGEIDVEVERSGDGPRNLRDFERVRQAIAEMIAVPAGENLRLGFESPESAGMNHAVAITLKIVAVGMRRLRKAASARLLDVHRVGGQHKAECSRSHAGYPVGGVSSRSQFSVGYHCHSERSEESGSLRPYAET